MIAISDYEKEAKDYERRACLKDKLRKDQLMRLFELGLTIFGVNDYMLDRHPNIDTVADLLMNGQLHEDALREIEQKEQKQIN